LGFAPETPADIYADIAILAVAVGASGRGEEVVSQMQGHIEAVPDRIAGLFRPKVFCEEWGKPLIVSQP
jgi:iron complex transport system substrate-binding protein